MIILLKTTKWSVAFMLLFTILFNIPSVNAENHSVTVNSKSINVRSGPGLTYDVITSLKRDHRVEVVATSGDWLQIKVGSGTGWIASWLTTDGTVATTSTIVSQVDHLNIRSGPSIGSSILGKMNAGEKATAISLDGDWMQVVVNGRNGWVHTDYIAEVTNPTKPNNVTEQANQFTVAVDALNVRKSADLSTKRVGLIYKGDAFEIKETDGNWIRISIGKDKEGWVYSFHGTVSAPPSPTQNGEAENRTITILSNGTNLRESPTTAAGVVARVNAGERFSITSESGEWYEVALPTGGGAFVAKWVVSLSDIEKNEQQVKPKNKARVPGTLKGLTIVIDPGHGGNDRGATGASGTDEKNITLLTSELLASKLTAAGANVILTRETDAYVSLRKRVALSSQHEADAFISIHYDAATQSSISGFTTYYTLEHQKELAIAVHNGLSTSVALRDRGTQSGNYLVLRENKQNAILIELGFLSNPSEERAVTTNLFREQATLGIYNGLLDYFNSN